MGLNILIIRFSSIGDIVLTSPVMRCIKNEYPSAHITFLTKKIFVGILETTPHVNTVISLDNNWKELKETLQKQKFDYIIDLHNNLRTKLLCQDLKGQYTAFNKLNVQKWLMVNFKINRLPSAHIVERYLDAANLPNVKYDGAGLDYFIPAETKLHPLPATEFIAMAIGGQHYTKRLPAEKLKEIISALKKPVVLLGGKDELEIANELIAAYPNTISFNYCGTISLNESALILSKSNVLLTHDTGMMHIGAALDIPIVSIWGNTIPEFGMQPFFKNGSRSVMKSLLFEVKGLKCRPCSKIGHNQCPKGHFKCMKQQDTGLIAQALNRLSSAEEK